MLSLYRTFVEVTVNLTLTYTLEGKTKTDTVELKLPEMTEFIYDRTSGSEHAYGYFKLNPSAGTFEYSATYEYSSIETNGFMGTYVLDAENKTITLSVSKVRVSDYLITDGWYTESELLNARRKSAKNALDKLKALEELLPENEGAELPSAADLFDTLYSLYELRATVWHEYCEEKETYKSALLEELGVSSLDDVDADPEKKAVLAGYLINQYWKRDILPEFIEIERYEADTITWPQIYARYEVDVDKKAAEDFSLMFVKNTTCDYDIVYHDGDDYQEYVIGALPFIDTKYDASKQWYEQLGDFGGYDEEQNMYTYLRLSYIMCTGSGNFEHYTGSWNDDYTKYTCEGTGEEPVVFTVTDNHNGTVSLAKGADSPVVLNFSCEELIEWPWH